MDGWLRGISTGAGGCCLSRTWAVFLNMMSRRPQRQGLVRSSAWGPSVLSRLMTRKEQALLAGLAGAIVLGAFALYWYNGATRSVSSFSASRAVSAPLLVPLDPGVEEGAKRLSSPTAPVAAPAPRSTGPSAPSPEIQLPKAGPIRVGIGGEVSLPGLYAMDTSARVSDLLKRSGRPKPTADLSAFDLNAPLIDATTLTVPRRRERVPNPRQYLRPTGGAAVR